MNLNFKPMLLYNSESNKSLLNKSFLNAKKCKTLNVLLKIYNWTKIYKYMTLKCEKIKFKSGTIVYVILNPLKCKTIEKTINLIL